DDDDPVPQRPVVHDLRGELRDREAAKILEEWIAGLVRLANARHRCELAEKGLGGIQEAQRGPWATKPNVLGLLLQIMQGKFALNDAAGYPSPRSSGLRAKIRSLSAVQSSAVISLVGLWSPARSLASSS